MKRAQQLGVGERTYRAAVASGATGDLSHTWETLPPEAKERWEACGRMVDAATRADVVAQVDGFASSEFAGEKWKDERWAVDYALDCVRMGLESDA